MALLVSGLIPLKCSIEDYFIAMNDVLEADIRSSIVECSSCKNQFATSSIMKSVKELVTNMYVVAGFTYLVLKLL